MFFSRFTSLQKQAEILPLATALIARLRSQFNHVFTLIIVMPRRFKSINYHLNRPKIELSLSKKDCKIFRVLSALLPDPRDSRLPDWIFLAMHLH